MYKKPIILLFNLIISISIFSQNSNDSIQIIKLNRNYSYEQNSHVLNYQEIKEILKADKEATRYLKSAKLSNDISTALRWAGGFLIGYPIGGLIVGKKVNASMLTVGIGFLVIDIPVSIAVKKNLFKSISVYNDHKNATGLIDNDYDLQMGITQNGIGFTFKF
ncbi:MAG: hypothetical protein PHP99_03200 [Paludibacter sp.]|nr:hypothetical protein [Paludibacter sp.]